MDLKLIVGWITLITVVTSFADLMGVVQNRLYPERSMSAECHRRGIGLKIAVLIIELLVLAFLAAPYKLG